LPPTFKYYRLSEAKLFHNVAADMSNEQATLAYYCCKEFFYSFVYFFRSLLYVAFISFFISFLFPYLFPFLYRFTYLKVLIALPFMSYEVL